jgi:Icc-related predicted phosphoesterase
MRILAVSDYPTPVPDAGPVDLVLSCGDLPPEHLEQLARTLNAPLYYVRGNHDLRPCEAAGCTDLHGRLARHRELRLAGLEGCRWYNGGPFQYTEGQMRAQVRHLGRQLRGVDIVVAHAPPRHIHDREDPCHQGFEAFRRLIERYAPRYFLHGHVHVAFARAEERLTAVGPTRVVNCSGSYLFELEAGGTDE